MKSGKQRRLELESRRAERKNRSAARELALQLAEGSAIRVNHEKIVSRSAIPRIPEFYIDRQFTCRSCGKEEVWTASQQQWWYEEAKGPIESHAVACSECRKKEKIRKAEARRVHLEGLNKKNEN